MKMNDELAKPPKPRFLLGQIIVSPATASALSHPEKAETVQRYLSYHQTGEWGLVRHSIEFQNEEAVENCDDLFSMYGLGDKELWIVTDGLRRFTVLLMPTEDC
jgi:hypothetical protein